MSEAPHMKHWPIITLAGLIVMATLFSIFLGPNVLGDTPSYVQAIHVMNGGQPGADFIPFRLLTTFGALEIVRFFGTIFGDIYLGWFFMNLIFFMVSGYVLFALIRRITGSPAAACLGSLFLAGNYGFLLFGPNFLMDIGGWTFYICTLYFVWRYAESKNWHQMLYAAICVGVGGLFKEYGFLGGATIAVYLIVEAVRNRSAKKPLGLLVGSGVIALVPTVILYAYIYHQFGYTYLDWFGANAEHYVYHSRILEYIKALGSLYNLLAILVIGGALVIVKNWRTLSREIKTFLAAALVSFLPVFCWPAITQRILTVTVPFAIIVASFLFTKYPRRWWIFAAALVLYVLATFFMDSYLLSAVNVPF